MARGIGHVAVKSIDDSETVMGEIRLAIREDMLIKSQSISWIAHLVNRRT